MVEEQVIWRWVQLFAACLVLGVLDLLYLLFFAKMQASPCPLRENAAAKAKTILLLCAITFVASIPYFVEYTYYTHDVSFHLARITSLAAELGSGQFPVRMMTTMNNGYGYASALFYCDLFLYLPAILYNCMLPLQAAYHIYIICINCATCAICYYAFGKMTQSRSIGMMSALLYTLAAYRLTNVYTRAAVGEYTAMTFFPLVVLGLWGIYQSKKPRYQDWLPLSLGMAGIIQSHVLSVEMVVIFLGLLCLLLCKQTLQCARIKSFVLAAGLCMGLTAWFWVPFLQSYLQMDLLATEIMLEQTQSGGILLSQLLALSGYVQGNGYLAMPLMLGWALLAGGLLAAFYMLQRSRLALAVKPQYQAMCLAVGLGTLAAIFTLDVFPWTQIAYSTHDLVVKAVNSIQFPWRYLAIATLCFVVATAFALLLVKQHHPQYYRALCGVLVALTLCTTGLFYTDFVNNTETDPKYTIDSYDLVINWGEYMMEGSIPDAQYTNAVQTSDDALIITSYDKTNGVATAVYQNTSDAPQTVSLPIYNYPYYQATDAATGAAYAITNGENNRIEITVAAGSSGTITVQYVPPMLWHLAEFVSAASLLFVVGMAFYQRKKQKRTIPAEAATA